MYFYGSGYRMVYQRFDNRHHVLIERIRPRGSAYRGLRQ